MTVPNEERRASYNALQPTTEFEVGFRIYGAADIEVWHEGEIVSTDDYTVEGSIITIGDDVIQLPPYFSSGYSEDAKIVFDIAVEGAVVIIGKGAPRRTTGFTEGVGVPARDFNAAFDTLTAWAREIYDRLNRAIVAPPGETIDEADVFTARDQTLEARDVALNVRASTQSIGTALSGQAIRAAQRAQAILGAVQSVSAGIYATLAEVTRHARTALQAMQGASVARAASAAYAGQARQDRGAAARHATEAAAHRAIMAQASAWVRAARQAAALAVAARSAFGAMLAEVARLSRSAASSAAAAAVSAASLDGKRSIERDTGGDGKFQLVGDADAPGNSKYYGTDGSGTRGFHALPEGGGGGNALADRLQFFHLAKLSQALLNTITGVVDPFASQDDIASSTNAAYSATGGYFTSLWGNDSNCKVLLTFEGADGSTTITDSNAGGAAKSWTAAGNAQLDTAEAVLGTSSLLCDGTGDYVTASDHADFDLGSGDFTIQVWFKVGGGAGTRRFLFGQQDSAGGNMSYRAELRTSNDFRFSADGIANFTTSATFTDTSWHHFAITRNGSTWKAYMDGVKFQEATSALAVFNSSNNFSVGRSGEFTTLTWNGWIKNFSIHKGVALWTADSFDVPTQPFGAPEMELISENLALTAQPETARLSVVVGDDVDLADFDAFVSRDSGATWEEAANLALTHVFADGRKLYEDEAIDVSGQDPGTALAWKITTPSSLDDRAATFHGTIREAVA